MTAIRDRIAAELGIPRREVADCLVRNCLDGRAGRLGDWVVRLRPECFWFERQTVEKSLNARSLREFLDGTEAICKFNARRLSRLRRFFRLRVSVGRLAYYVGQALSGGSLIEAAPEESDTDFIRKEIRGRDVSAGQDRDQAKPYRQPVEQLVA